MNSQIFTVEIEKVEPHPQILKTYVTKNLQGLKLTMEMVGHLLEPIKVVQRQDKYLIFDGISRYFAAIQLGWKIIDVEAFDLTEQEVQDQAVIRGIVTKRSLLELCNRIELFLDILGSSQGKKRETLGDLAAPDDDFGLAGKDRYEIACEIASSSFSASSIRRLLAVKDWIKNGNEEVNGLGIWEKLESGEMKINNAFNMMNNYKIAKDEQGSNELLDTLKIIKEGNYELHNSSCEDLSEIPNESVDCCIGSPPYFRQRIYPDGVRDTSKRQLGMEKTVDEYVQNQVNIYHGVYQKLKDTGSLFIVIADSYDQGEDCLVIEKLAVQMKMDGWHCIQKWYWAKENPKPQSKIKRLLPSYEIVLHFVKNKDNYYWREFKNWKEGGYKAARGTKETGIGKKRKNTSWTLAKPMVRFRNFLDEQDVKNVIHANGFNWQELKEIDPNFRHDAPYPSYLPLLPILMTTKVGDTVMDIYNGCGTTTAVARYLKRKAIGYDTDTKSHEFTSKRLRVGEQNLPTDEEVKGFEDEYMEPAA
jgi:DNA modification methylase